MLLTLAAKNLLRYKRRTFITGFAIAVGVMFYIFMDSLLIGWFDGTEKQYVDYEVASGRIVRADWWEDRERLPVTLSIEDTAALTSLLDELGIAYTPRTDFFAEMIFYKDPFPEDGSFPVKITAVDPNTDGKIFKLAESIGYEYSRGEFLSEGSDGIVVGNVLADRLGIEVGYPIRLQFTGRMGYNEVLDTTVIGVVKSGSHLVNLSGVFLAMDAADYYLEMEGAVTGYSFKLPLGGGGMLQELEQRLPPEYIILGYEEIAADFMAMQEMESGGAGVFLFLIFIIAAVGVTNTMMMSIFERRREIGMMRALGLSDRRITLMFFYEAAMLGMVGAVIGMILGALFNIYMVEIGLNYGAMLNSDGDFIDFGGLVIDSRMKGVWNAQSFVTAGALSVIISGIVALFPTRRMLKTGIPDNLRMDG